ncbi:MAG: DUF1146 domain-containing protein [Acholeplasmataceae bacterium]|jgi:uncharacterized membrane protein YwzB|nr:DUF1146 domain-containing protein [Acholeplasmataceae bacterium]
MIDNLISMWFFIILIGFTPLTYRALMALDFSKLFRRNSGWQIRFLVTFVSFAFAFIIAYAFLVIYERIFVVVR